MKIVVLLGGNSEERDVSLASGAQVANGLRENGHDVVSLDPAHGLVGLPEEEELLSGSLPRTPSLESQNVSPSMKLSEHLDTLNEADIVFPVLHGGVGENGTIQALLDLLGVPYVGSDLLGCAIAMNKDVTKKLLRSANIATPDWILANTVEEVMEVLEIGEQ